MEPESTGVDEGCEEVGRDGTDRTGRRGTESAHIDRAGRRARARDAAALRTRSGVPRRTLVRALAAIGGTAVAVLVLGRILPGSQFRPGIVVLAFAFQVLDAGTGMGFGTALTPLLLTIESEPLAVIPVMLAVQVVAGGIAGGFHHEFQNVHFTWHDPMRDASRYVIILSGVGVAATVLSVPVTLLVWTPSDRTIITWVAAQLFVMGVAGIVRVRMLSRRQQRGPHRGRTRPGILLAAAGLAGTNKAIGAGGYGPVIMLGLVHAGMYEKAAAGIVPLTEAIVSAAAVIAYLTITAADGGLDLSLLPSLLLGSSLAAIVAPYLVRLLPPVVMRHLVPVYAFAIGTYTLVDLHVLS